MLTEVSVIDQITVLDDGQVLVRRADKVLRDGVEIAKVYHRHVVSPGQSLTVEDERVRSVCEAVHTKAVVDTFQLAHKE